MKKHEKPPKKKLRDKPDEPGRKLETSDAREREQPAAAERTDETIADRPAQNQPSSSESPSEEEMISVWSKPITNQDEQEKITNAEGDIPVPNQ